MCPDNQLVLAEPAGDSGPTTPSGRQLLSQNMDYPRFQRVMCSLAEKISPTLKLGANISTATPGVHFYVVSSTQEGPKAPSMSGTITLPINPDSNGEREQLAEVWTRELQYYVQFNAVANNPADAEYLISRLDDFIIMVTPIIMENGCKGVFYEGRNFDSFVVQLHQGKSIASVRYNFRLSSISILPVAKLADVQVITQSLTLDRVHDYADSIIKSVGEI